MISKSKTSTKLSEKCRKFMKKMRKNRIKMDVDEESLSYWKLADVIVKYFKAHPNEYLDMLKTPEDKNA